MNIALIETSRPNDQALEGATELLRRDYLRYARVADEVRRICEEVAQDDLIRCSIQHRVKSPDRLKRKLLGWREKQKLDGMVRAEDIVQRIGDLAAVRVCVYLDRDCQRLCDRLKERLAVRHIEAKEVRAGMYRAIHLDVELPTDALSGPEGDAVRGLRCEIQITTLLAHVYSEIEHDLRYKPLTGAISEDEERLLNTLGHLAQSGDLIILSLIEQSERRVSENLRGPTGAVAEFDKEGQNVERKEQTQLDAIDLRTALAPRLRFLSKFDNNAGQVLKLVTAVGLRDVQTIEQRLLGEQVREEWHLLASRFGEFDAARGFVAGGKMRPFDAESADGLLLLLAHRERGAVITLLDQQGPGKPPRAVSLLKDMLQALAPERT